MSHETNPSNSELMLSYYAKSAFMRVDALFIRQLARDIAVNGERAVEPKYLKGFSMIHDTDIANDRTENLSKISEFSENEADGIEDEQGGIFVNISIDTSKENNLEIARRFKIRMRYRGPDSVTETFILEELVDGAQNLLTQFVAQTGRQKYSLREELADIHVAPLVEQCLLNFEPEFGE